MEVAIHGEVFELFPEYVRAVVIARDLNNQGVNNKLVEMLREEEIRVVKLFEHNNLTTYPNIANWRNAYSKLGLKASRYYSSIEALARRVRRGDPLPYINTLVAVMNMFSVRYLVPCGGDDLDAISGNVTLRFADGNETFTPFNSYEPENPDEGELIYVDDGKTVLCRRWNWRQGNVSKITENSKNAVINIDCLPPISFENTRSMVTELAELISRVCAAEVTAYLLTPIHTVVKI